jgi:uncharacterized surface protein with fasciclin (FAS1) repeats
MNPEDMTIAEVAAGSGDFDILVAALDAAELTGAVADPEAALTVFAPTDDAFAGLAAALGYEGDPSDEDAVFGAIAGALTDLAPDGDPIPLLSDILLYHVVGGELSAAEVTASETVATLGGAEITPRDGRLVDLEPDLLDPEIAIPDIMTANGTIHAIDGVLLPLDVPGNDRPTIAEIAGGNPGFEVLTLALDAAGLTETLDDPDAEFTAFAPNDAAFFALASERFGYTGDADEASAIFTSVANGLSALSGGGDPIPLLTDILLYHVSEGARTREALVDAASVATLNGTPVIPSEAGIIDADPDAANAGFVDGLTDLRASNGLVQVVDSVLLPVDLEDPAPTGTIADLVAASGDGLDDNPGDFDVLLAALQTAGLVGALSDPADSFTVAAPTDQAFIELARGFGAEPADEAEALDAIVGVLTGLAPDDDPVPLLEDILLYHVFAGEASRVDLAEGPALTSLFGPAPTADGDSLADADPGLRDPRFLDGASDIVTENGIVHAIDGVLLPIDAPEAVSTGGPEDDTIPVSESTVAVMGGAGEDTAVFSAALSEAEFGFLDGGFSVAIGERTVDVMEVESFQFADAAVEVDTGAAAASVSRLYGAAFGRDGDLAGQAFWTGVAEGPAGIEGVAEAFTTSPEFAALFGEDPDHGMFVSALYDEVLGRGSDGDGQAFWENELDRPDFDEADLLLAFSESEEYRERVADSFDDGVLLLA